MEQVIRDVKRGGGEIAYYAALLTYKWHPLGVMFLPSLSPIIITHYQIISFSNFLSLYFIFSGTFSFCPHFRPILRYLAFMADQTPNNSAIQIPAKCEMIERVLRSSPATWLMYFLLLLLSSLAISIFVLLYQFHKQRIAIHRNLVVCCA